MKNYSKLKLKNVRSTRTRSLSLKESAALLHRIYPDYPNWPIILHRITNETI
jgi:hypothetical protein